MSVFALRLSEDLKDKAASQAAAAGISLNQFIATAVASRVGALAEADRYFAARAARTVPGRGKEILKSAGIGNAPRPDDRLDSAE